MHTLYVVWALLVVQLMDVLTAMAQVAPLAAAYAPAAIGTPCPSGTSLIRMVSSANSSISSGEATFVQQKFQKTQSKEVSLYLSNLEAYSQKVGITLPSYLTPNTTTSNTGSLFPRIGLSVSGGGYRAALFGLSLFNAFDARNTTSTDAGLGGVLQISLYMAGLSGGSWAITSLAQANFPTIPEVFFGPSTPPSSDSGGNGEWGGWNADIDILPVNLTYVAQLVEGLADKARQFPVSFADLWALALARHFANGTTFSNFFVDTVSTHGSNITFSSLLNLSAAVNGDMPFPIVIADSRMQNTANVEMPDLDFVPLNNTLFENTLTLFKINPIEFGSWDAGLQAFTPTKFIGSANTSSCITGFDKAAFVMGTSSNLFNEFNLSASILANSSIGPAITFLNSSFVAPSKSGTLQANVELDGSIWPNPFKGLNASTFPDSSQDVLTLVDGGEDGQVIPLAPLLIRSRALDVIIAMDGSNDLNGFARGASMVASQNRTTENPSLASIYPLPPLPTSTAVFAPISEGGQGLVSRPTFFGCGNFTNVNGQNVTSGGGDIPLIVYLGNGAPPPRQVPLTNTSTDQTVYSNSQISGILDQVFDIATQGFSGNGNTTKDSQWPICLACAIFEPSRARAQNVARDSICENCFSRYCWDGSETLASGSPSASATGPSSSETGKSSATRTVGSLPPGHLGVIFSMLLVLGSGSLLF